MSGKFDRSWLNWLMIVPASFAAWAGIQLLLAFLITMPFYSALMDAIYGPWIELLKQFVFYAAAPYWAVIAGCYFAPHYKFIVAVALSVVAVALQVATAVLLNPASLEMKTWFYLGVAATVIAVTIASIQIRRENATLY